MNTSLKNYSAAALILFLLAASFGIVQGVRSYTQSRESLRTFSVSAQGKAVAVPDIAQFSFGVITEGGLDVAKLQQENTAKSNAIIDFLKGSGIDPKDIQTQSYSVSPRYQGFDCSMRLICPPSEIVGYTVSQTVSVKIRDFTKISQALSQIVEKGANSVSQLSFSVDDQTLLKQQAREEAIAKAKEDAKTMARSAGFSIGRLVSVNEGTYFPVYGMGGASLEKAQGPTIEPGSQEISVQVTLVYEIK
ncbi:MAG: SIMPL domain-containing protein [Candidatus Wildermuthbacteria bacterium]|nr:SIMPL domain-containing protein [Candidatus Wildermuthbacteria bacterium]